ncbi:MAG TPA: phage holin family protein [Methylomirabilota bacterium]|jgi:uncharacterized membrane protein YqjE|nr:phage holin family protein [Methylomirabilota bacterium]
MRRAEDPVYAPPHGPTFGELVARLRRQVQHLLEQKLELARTELRSALREVLRDAVLISAGAVLALVGVLHLVIALALWIGDAVGSRPGGFAILGGVVALAGGMAVAIGIRGLRSGRVLPAQTVTELRRDVAWIKNEL